MHDGRTPDSWSAAWPIRPHRRFAMPLAGGFWAPSDSWRDCEASPVRYLSNPPVAEARQLSGLDPKRIFAAVTAFYGLDDAALSRRHDPHLARAVAAWLCRRHTEASLRELAACVGTFASRQRPQPHAPDRNAAESIPRAVQGSS